MIIVDEVVYVATDWWGFAATLVAGILTAIATMAAVIYTNSRTKKQLKEQEVKFENERKEEYKRSKFVVIKPTLMLTTFTGLLDNWTNLLFIMIITEFYFFREKMDLIFMMIDRNNFLKLAGCFRLKIRQILILMKLQ